MIASILIVAAIGVALVYSTPSFFTGAAGGGGSN
jgi:hypothetical protein